MRRLFATGGGVVLCSLFLSGIPARRRSWRSMLLALFAFGALGIIGCGSSTNSASSGTQAGTYTATIVGTSGTTTVNAQVAITVQ